MSAPEMRDSSAGVAEMLSSARAAWSGGHRGYALRQWKRAMTAAPGNVAPYLNLARAHLDLRIDSPWLEIAAAMLSGNDPLANRNLAVLAQHGGREGAAIRHMRRSVILAPDQRTAMSLLAKLSPGRSAIDDNLKWAVRAAVSGPVETSVWMEVLSRLARAGLTEAAAKYAAILPIGLTECPDELLWLMSQLFAQTARYREANSCTETLTRRHPTDANARRAHALALRKSDDVRGAVVEARRAVLIEPGGFDNLCRLGSELARNAEQGQAVLMYRRGIHADPSRRLEVADNLGAASVQLRDVDAATHALQEAMLDHPDRALPYMNMSTLCFQALDLAGSERFGRRALAAGPNLADAWYNFGTLQRHLGRISEARRSLEHASGLADKPMYRFVRAMLELGDGDPVDGVRRYESRWDVPGFSASRMLGEKPSLPLPVWRGDPMPSGTLAIWGEQGVGDEIWFAGYLPWAVARVGRVVLEVADSLRALMQRSFPTVDVRARGAMGSDSVMAAADVQLPLGGLMPLCDAGVAPVPTGYLKVDQGRAAEMRRCYLQGRTGIRQLIGISWRSVKIQKGRPPTEAARVEPAKQGRSFEAPLDQWGDLFGMHDTAFVSLQYGDVSEDARLVRERFGVDLIVDSEVDAYKDLDGLAAQVASVDRVVSVANSTVAMAHALGKPVDVIPRLIQDDWRYKRSARSTRWLPTARCTWQRAGNDWATPIAEVADRLLHDV